MITFIPFDFIPNDAPISANVSYVADHRVRSSRMPGALQRQVGPAQDHLPEIVHAVCREPTLADVWWVSASHQGISDDVEASQLVEQREREGFPLSAFHREPDDAVMIWAGEGRVVPFEEPEVRSQVVVDGVFHR